MKLYENEKANSILARMLARVGIQYDKRVGSIIFNNHAPTAEELAILYEALDYVLDQALPDTAIREFLIRHCASRKIVPYAATAAIVIGRFTPAGFALKAGDRFNCGEYFYRITEKINNPGNFIEGADPENYVYYYLECETEGEAPNGTTGRAIPVENIDGLKSAEIIEVSIHGEDEEETEALRRRYYDSFGAEAFAGNVADYKEKILAMNGVGGVKVYPGWNGGSTSRVVIAATGNVVPSITLVENVQGVFDPMVIDPEEKWGLGYGKAPIGHHVTVMGASGEVINVATILTIQSGYTFADIEAEVKAVLDAYYTELNTNWMYISNVIVRIAEINSRLLAIERVIDVTGTTINGLAENAVIDADSLAVQGTFTNNG